MDDSLSILLEYHFKYSEKSRAAPIDMVILRETEKDNYLNLIALEFKYRSTYSGSGRDKNNLDEFNEDIEWLGMLNKIFQRGYFCYLELAGRDTKITPEYYIDGWKDEGWYKGYYREARGYAWHDIHWNIKYY